MKTVLLFILLNLPSYLLAQQNLSWEEKVSPKYQVELPTTEKNTSTTLNSSGKRSNITVKDPYQELLTQRDGIKANIAHYEQQPETEKNKQYLDKYRVSLALVEKQIKEYKAPQKKEKK